MEVQSCLVEEEGRLGQVHGVEAHAGQVEDPEAHREANLLQRTHSNEGIVSLCAAVPSLGCVCMCVCAYQT